MKRKLILCIAIALLLAIAVTTCFACSTKLVSIKFYVDGKLYVTKTIDKGGSLDDVPEVPAKDGYKSYWSVTNFDEINEDTSVHAVYEKDTYTVSFYADNVLIKSVTEKKGKTITDIPPVPEKEGYDGEWNVTLFNGITTDTRVDAVYTAKGVYVTFYRFSYKFEQKDVLSGEEVPVGTYYEKNGDEYILTKDKTFVNGKTYYAKQREVYATNKVNEAGIVEVPLLPTVEGRNVRWRKLVRTENGEEFGAFVSDGITASEEVVAYEFVTIKLVDPIDGSFTELEADVDEILTEPKPGTARTDYLFYGWFIDENGKNKADFSKAFEQNATFYAKWISNKRTDGLKIEKNVVIGYDGEESEVFVPHVNEDNDGNRYEVTEIADRAFYGNLTVTAVRFPITLEKIGTEAFCECANLVSAEYPDGCNVKILSDAAFKQTGITSAEVSEKTVEIGESCFENCADLVTVKGLGESAVTEIAQNAFYGCSSIDTVVVPDTVTKINANAFAKAAVAKITFNDETKIIYIGDGAFYECASFVGISAINAEYVGQNAFYGCVAIEKITFVAGSATDVSGGRSEYIYDVTFAAGNGKIASGAIKEISSVKKITIAEGVWAIEDEGLALNPSLAATDAELTVVLPDTLIKIGKKAFSGRTDLKKIVLPDGLTEIGDYAFYGLNRLAEVTTGSGTKFTSVGRDVFGETDWFEGFDGVVIIGKTVFGVSEAYCRSKDYNFIKAEDTGFAERIAPYAFYGNDALTGAELGQRIAYVGEYAFASCPSLETFRFNSSAGFGSERIVEDNAIAENAALKEVLIYDDVNAEKAFGGRSGAEIIKLEYAGKNSVADGTLLTVFADMKELYVGDGFGRIADRAFASANRLEKVKIGKDVAIIGDGAFENCLSLATLDLSESAALETIGTRAFYRTSVTNEQTFVFPDTVKTVENEAFGSASLTDVEFGENLTFIGASAFANNVTLKRAVISLGTEEIGEYAFLNCNLSELTLPESVKKLGRGILAGNDGFKAITLSGDLSVSDMFSKIENGSIVREVPRNFRTATVLKGEIGEKQFFGVTSLQTVSVMPGVSAIGASAFEGCTLLMSAEIPASVTSVGERAFAGCRSLTSVRFDRENGPLDKMGREVFAGDVSLSYVSLPQKVVEYDFVGVFDGCKVLTTVNLPETVTEIGDYAYRNCSSLVTPSVHDGVTAIGVSAFEGCAKVDFDDVRFDSLVSIGERAFASCSSMHGLKAEKAKYIGKDAFLGATELNEITVTSDKVSFYTDKPENVVTVNVTANPAENAFDGCVGIKTIVFYGEDGNSIRTAINGIDTDKITVFVGAKAYETLSDKAYLNPTSEGFFEFSYDEATLTAKIVGINVDAKVAYLPSSAVKDETTYPVTAIGAGAFGGNATLEKVVVPAEITDLEENAFFSCENLSYVRFESGSRLKTICASAFAQCVNLTEMIFPSSLNSIGEAAFNACEKLGAITFFANSKLNKIGSYAFNGATSLEKVALTSEIKEIGVNAFAGCIALKTFDFGSKSAIKTLSNGLFSGCSALSEVSVPDGVTTIGTNAFKACVALKSAVIPDSTETIGTGAFGSSGITTVIFGRKLVTVGDEAFKSCNYLTEAILPDSVTVIGKQAFADCGRLLSVKIGENVRNIGENAFYNARNLAEAEYAAILGEDLTEGTNAFYGAGTNSASGITFTVGEKVERIPAYLFATSDLTYAPDIRRIYFDGTSSCEEIGEKAFAGLKTLASIDLPVSLLKIGKAAFDGNDGLEVSFESAAVTAGFEDGWDDGLTTQPVFGKNNVISGDYAYVERFGKAYLTKYYGEETTVVVPVSIDGLPVSDVGAAFERNEKVEKIVMPGNADRAGSFYGCSSLETVVLPENISYISSYAFYNCASLDNIVIPAGVERIGENAFYGCGRLETVYFDGETAAAMATEGNHPSLISANAANYYFAEGITVRPDSEVYGKIPDEDAINGYDIYTKLFWTKERDVGKDVFVYLVGDGTDERTYKAVVGGTGSMRNYEALSLVPWRNYADRITVAVVGKDVSSLGQNSFAGLSALKSVRYDAVRGNYSQDKHIFSNSGTNGGFTLEIGAETEIVPAYLFYNVSSLTEIVYAENCSMKEIGQYAFYGCSGLNEIVVVDTVEKIGTYAFAACRNVKEITVGKNVSIFGNRAFYGATSLDTLNYNAINASDGTSGSDIFGTGEKTQEFTVNISAETARVPAYAFYANENLKEVAFSGKTALTEIGREAFYKCTALAAITLPASLETIGEKAFAEAKMLGSVNFAIGENKLKNIGAEAFLNTEFYRLADNWKADKGEISERGVLILANKYFIKAKSGLSGEYSVPTDVKTIASDAFGDCNGLEFIRVPITVEYIGENAFAGCVKLKTLYLASKAVAAGLENENSFGGIAKNALHVYVSSTLVEDAAVKVGLFVRDNYTAIDEKIDFSKSGDYYAYTKAAWKTGDVKAYLINDENNLGYYEAVITGEGATDDYAPGASPWNEFADVIATATVKSGVKKIGANAFRSCSALTELNIARGVEIIGENAFFGCESLTELTVPSSVTTLQNGAFGNCYSLKKISYMALRATDSAKDNGIFANAGTRVDSGVELNVDRQVQYVPAYLFYPLSDGTGTPDIRRISFLSSNNINDCTEIAPYAFAGLKNLGTVQFASGNVLEKIGEFAFYGCSSLESVTLTAGIKSVGKSAFKDCYELKNVIFDATAFETSEEGNKAFESAGRNDGFALTVSVKSKAIPSFLFEGGSYMTSLEFVSGGVCEKIGERAFEDCSSLQTIVVPDTVKTIGAGAFSGCLSLKNYTAPFVGGKAEATKASASTLFGYIFGTAEKDGASAVKQNFGTGSAVYYVPDSVAYVGITKYINMYFGTFSGCEYVQTVYLNVSNGVEKIFEYGVNENGDEYIVSSLDNGAYVDAEAFYGCSSLTAVNFSGMLQWIGQNAFKGCTELIEITVPENVKEIGAGAFEDCKGLTAINFNAIECADAGTAISANETRSNNVFAAAGENKSGIAVKIGKQVKSVPSFLFAVSGKNPAKIASLNFAEGAVCSRIGESAFRGAGETSFTKISIAESVTKIGKNAFAGTAYYLDDNNRRDNVLYVDGCLIKADFKSTTYSYNILTGTRIIADNAFEITLTVGVSPEIVIVADSVTHVGAYAFNKLTALKEVVFNSTSKLVSIGERAFNGCTNLGTAKNEANEDIGIYIRSEVSVIGSYAFAGCDNLTKIWIDSAAIAEGLMQNDSVTCGGILANATTVYVNSSIVKVGSYLRDNYEKGEQTVSGSYKRYTKKEIGR